MAVPAWSHQCGDHCLSRFAGPPGVAVTVEVSGSAGIGTKICVVWNDRRSATLLATPVPHFSTQTCPPPLPLERTKRVRLCLPDRSRGGAQVCRIRLPSDPEYRLATFQVSTGDRLPEQCRRCFEHLVRFRVPAVKPGLYLISWLDCPPGDCAHLNFTAFRVTAW